MKYKYFLSLFILCCSMEVIAQSDVLLWVNGEPVTKTEIRNAYLKNDATENRQDISDFVDSYINFKMNVAEAKSQRMDTLASVRRDLSSYRLQLSRPYSQDSVTEKKYIEKVYNRLLENIDINHVLLPYETQRVFPADTLCLYNKALELRETLLENGFKGEGYIEYTNHPTIEPFIAHVNGHIGWIRPFMFPAQVDDAAYEMPVGEISMPIRSNLGYHIVQVVRKQAAAESLDLDQVMFNFPSVPPTQAQKDSVLRFVESIYKDLGTEADFKDLCNEFSRAYNTGDRGCAFGIINFDTQLPPSFIYGAYSIENIGEISSPVVSDNGVHIVRLKERIPATPPLNTIYDKLRQKIIFSDYNQSYAKHLKDYLVSAYKVHFDEIHLNELYELATNARPMDSLFIKMTEENKRPLFLIEEKAYNVEHLASYIKRQLELKNQNTEEISIVQSVNSPTYSLSTNELSDLLTNFVIREVNRHAFETLEDRFPEFKEEMDRFEEELLFFEVKNRNVWIKADGTETTLDREEEKWSDYLKSKYSVEIDRKQLSKWKIK